MVLFDRLLVAFGCLELDLPSLARVKAQSKSKSLAEKIVNGTREIYAHTKHNVTSKT
jgi:hypothetical protein